MELIDVVDKDNQIVDSLPRKVVHERGLPHRTVMFFVMDNRGKILVTKRTENKDFFPGYWSIVLGGHVSSGETYEEALVSEMREELGAKGDYVEIGGFVKDIEEETEHVRVYKVRVEPDELSLCEKEIEKSVFWDKEKILDQIYKKDFLPETFILVDYIDIL